MFPAGSRSGSASGESDRVESHRRTGRSVCGRFLAVAAAAVLLTTGASSQPDEYSAPEKSWRTIESAHFFVHYHEGAERTARAAAKIAEEIYGPITSLYGHEPDTRVSLIIKDISDYSNGAAYFFNNKIEIWASPLDFELRGTHNWLRNVISHEFTHIIQIQASLKWGRGIPALTFQWFGYETERRRDVLYGYPNTLVSYPFPGVIVPPWMAEGTAQYMRRQFGYEHWDTHRDMILRSYVLSDSMLSWPEMQAFGKTSLGNESVYNAGYNLTRYIAQTYGEDAVVAVTREMRKPFVFTVDAAFRNVLGVDGTGMYATWKDHLRAEYAARIAPVLRNRKEGNLIAAVGFGNFHPVFGPDGRTLWYVSNKTADFFGQSSVYRYDLETEKEDLAVSGVRSAISLSPDGKSVVYSKYNPPSVYGHLYYDLYRYDTGTKEESRITEDLRANNPSYSPDGSRIAFVFSRDGSVNIGMVDADGSRFRQVTDFKSGEQAFTPQWAPDGSHLVFAYSGRAQRSVARIDTGGSGFRVLIEEAAADCRDPRYTADGAAIVYASDRTGIFNIYRHDVASGTSVLLTNVTGGAFMPASGARGELAYAAYTSGGYKIALIKHATPLAAEAGSYLPAAEFAPAPARSDSAGRWEWEALRSFDDTRVPETASRPYKNVFQSMMFFPTLRIDEYNPENTGLALFKPGLMLYSSDVLGRLELLASAAINTKWERDLYLSLTYKDRIPLFSDLGIYPALTLEAFNVTRNTRSSIALPLDTIGVDVTFNLLEFAVRARHNLVDNHTRIDFGYRHSRYTSTIGSFRNPETDALSPAMDNLYLIGNDLHVGLHHHRFVPARDAEINPVGYRFNLLYDFEFDRFNPTGEFDVDFSSGLLVPKYQTLNFHRIESNALVAVRLPAWLHTLSVRLRLATIPGKEVDEFFNYYAGGVIGMPGYTYYALGGNELYTATLTYRFPIVPSLDLRLGHLLFDKLYGSVFYDVGDAASSPELMTLKGRKEDVGFDVRLESYSFSMYPTRIFFIGAYGLSRFTRTFNFQPVIYGREWRWYFGILFGFDLSDGLRFPR